MYDKILLEDLKDFKRGSENIYDLQFKYAEIRKIIANRTNEKVNLLKLFLYYEIIDADCYDELLERIRSDYKYSQLYLMGYIQNLE